jgi:tetratricopeptide (TPR) repeat protein
MSSTRRLVLALIATTMVSAPRAFPQASRSVPRSAADEVTLRIIVVGSADEAQRVVQQLTSGESFIELARRVSLDATAENGGLLGRMALSALRPELRSALEGLGAGQISPVVRIPTGFAVLTIVPDDEAGGSRLGNAAAGPAVAATGSVKYMLNISGMTESLVALSQFTKPADWNQDPRTICDTYTQSLAEAQASVERYLSQGSAAQASAPPSDLAHFHFVLGQTYAYQGKMDRAIEEFQKAREVAVSSLPPDAALQLEEALGIAYLHRSEIENGVYEHPGDRCLLSPRGIQAFAQTGDSEKAVEHLLRYLAEKPGELEVRWLLNLAYMTMGAYPGKVPPAFLIPPAALTSAEDVGRFIDVAPQAGVSSFASAGGLIVDDFDNDGRFDVVTSSVNSCAGMHFFHRNADGTFTERAAKAGLSGQLGGGLNMLQTDYNNDGFLDILLLRGGWESPQRKSLLRNNGNGTFTDVTVASGLARPATKTQTAVWTDINNDGFLDLFVGNEDGPAQLFLNKGDGTFVDIAHAAGVDRTSLTKGVAAADYDNDGWPDLYVSNLTGPNFLYHNNHDGTFTEVGKAAGVGGTQTGFATWFFDYDNDGWPDLFVTSYFMSVDETVRTYLGLPHNATTLKLYRNLGNGSFEDVTRQVGLDKVFMPMGANFGDIDNDGFPDIYLGTGNPSYGSTVGSALLHNNGGKSFVDVTASSGTGELHKGHGVAFADLDNDGDEEIVFVVGGATPGDAHALRLFHNPGHGNDWITLKLVGVKTNRAAVGARIKVTVENAGHATRAVYRTVGSGGSFGASPLAQHIGLGKAARIADVEIWWPTSNTRQHFAHPGKNQWLEIKEFAEAYTKLDRPRLPLGTPKNDKQSHAH